MQKKTTQKKKPASAASKARNTATRKPAGKAAVFSDQDVMTDVLTSEKHLTESYNTFACECATPTLKNEMVSLLEDSHQIQHQIFMEMQQRGWYQVEAADQKKVTQAKQKAKTMLN